MRTLCTPIYHRGETLKLNTWRRKKPSVSKGWRSRSRVLADAYQLGFGNSNPSRPAPGGRRAPAQSLQSKGSRGPGSLRRPLHLVPRVRAAVAALQPVLLRGSRLLLAGLARLPLPARRRPLPSAGPRPGRAWVPGVARARYGAGGASWPLCLFRRRTRRTLLPAAAMFSRPTSGLVSEGSF